MTAKTPREPVDFVFLDEAARHLLGYYVYRRFHNYLGSITNALRQQAEGGMSTGLTSPTPLGRAMLFDFRALDYDALIDVVGVYMYVLSCHKNANWRLMHRDDERHVLYLRGYDFEAAFSTGGGVAADIATWDTTGFTLNLPEQVDAGRELVKVLSPKEVDLETVTAERWYDDFDAMIQWIKRRPLAFYLNALHWKEGVLDLIPRMNHYIVYVSSLTESALWELDQLETDARRDRVTVVFDENAIAHKTSQLALQEGLGGQLGEAIWTKQGRPPQLNALQVREGLAEKFLVLSPEDFDLRLDEVHRRIDASRSELEPGRREKWIEFEFYPSVSDNDLSRLHDMSETLSELVAAGQTGPIDCLPLFVAQLQLRIHLTLLLGEHAGAGRALAAYAAVMHAAHRYYEPASGRIVGLSAENGPRMVALLARHGDYAEYAGRRLLAYGRSHEFGDYSEQANASWDAIFDETRASVDQFFATRGGSNSAPA
ncbi:MAG: hypothetical protein ACLP01_07920 [Solirubrobacteraceae bacterium]